MKKAKSKRKQRPSDDEYENEVIQKDMGLHWKSALPGIGLMGIAGVASALAIKKWRKAMTAIKGETV